MPRRRAPGPGGVEGERAQVAGSAAAISATIARAAATRSGAARIGRPTTRRSAPAAERVAGRGDALLVPRLRPGGADAGDDEEEVPPARGADGGDLLRRADDAVEARLPARGAARRRAASRGEPARADGGEGGGVERGQDRDGDQGGAGKPRLRGGASGPPRRTARIISAPPDAWQFRIEAPVRDGGRRGAADGVRDVVKLQVEEDAARRGDLPDEGRPLRDEGLEAQLEDADLRGEVADRGEDRLPVREVERDGEAGARGRSRIEVVRTGARLERPGQLRHARDAVARRTRRPARRRAGRRATGRGSSPCRPARRSPRRSGTRRRARRSRSRPSRRSGPSGAPSGPPRPSGPRSGGWRGPRAPPS